MPGAGAVSARTLRNNEEGVTPCMGGEQLPGKELRRQVPPKGSPVGKGLEQRLQFRRGIKGHSGQPWSRLGEGQKEKTPGQS